MKLHVIKTNIGLIPCHNSDRDKLTDSKLKMGETYEIDIKKPRNVKFHKKYFSLVNLCFENQEVFDESDDLRWFLTCKAGYYKRVVTDEGEMIVPLSISFANMDDVEFSQLYQKTIDVVIKFLGIDDRDELLNQLIEYM